MVLTTYSNLLAFILVYGASSVARNLFHLQNFRILQRVYFWNLNLLPCSWLLLLIHTTIFERLIFKVFADVWFMLICYFWNYFFLSVGFSKLIFLHLRKYILLLNNENIKFYHYRILIFYIQLVEDLNLIFGKPSK